MVLWTLTVILLLYIIFFGILYIKGKMKGYILPSLLIVFPFFLALVVLIASEKINISFTELKCWPQIFIGFLAYAGTATLGVVSFYQNIKANDRANTAEKASQEAVNRYQEISERELKSKALTVLIIEEFALLDNALWLYFKNKDARNPYGKIEIEYLRFYNYSDSFKDVMVLDSDNNFKGKLFDITYKSNIENGNENYVAICRFSDFENLNRIFHTDNYAEINMQLKINVYNTFDVKTTLYSDTRFKKSQSFIYKATDPHVTVMAVDIEKENNM